MGVEDHPGSPVYDASFNNVNTSTGNILIEQSSNFSDVNVHHNILNLNKSQVLYTNCDCLTQTKLSELKNFVAEKSPDIIAITQVFPKNSIFPHHMSTIKLKTMTSF